MNSFWHISLVREIKIWWRNSSLWLVSALFYLIGVLAVPIALGNNSNINLAELAPIVIWLVYILASLQLIANIFVSDYQNGWYQQLVISKFNLSAYMWVKLLLTTLCFIIPISLLTFILGLGYNLSLDACLILVLSLVVSAPALCFFSAIFSVITIASCQRAALISIMILPLGVPIYILGVASNLLYSCKGNPYPTLALLAAISIIAMLVCPGLIALSIRNSFEY